MCEINIANIYKWYKFAYKENKIAYSYKLISEFHLCFYIISLPLL